MLEFNYVLAGFVGIYLVQLFFSLWLERLNCGHLKQCGNKVPQPFKDIVDDKKLAEINSYTLEKSGLSQIEDITDNFVLLGLILSGFLPFMDFHSWGWELNFIVSGLLFFIVLSFVSYVVQLPFEYYHTFVTEEKYGFNRSTPKVWATDKIKELILSIIILAILLSPVLWMIRAFPHSWWFWGFLAVSFVQILLTVLYPVLIAPLFNKFEPLQDKDLSQKIKKLMEGAGIGLKGIFQMDAGRRSSHTNAYFTGLGKAKRIVLFDTLIQSSSHEETLAVLAHEVGHFKGKHIIKQLAFFEAAMLVFFYLTYRMTSWDILYSTFGFAVHQHHVGLFLIMLFWQKSGFFLKPVYMSLSRRYERQADSFAVKMLKTGKPLAASLKRLAADNLANLNPHPLYTRFNYSHPPMAERITLLEKTV